MDVGREQRKDYDSNMLWMIAQPTRKQPEKLPRFESQKVTSKMPKKTAKSIMDELVASWERVL